MLYFLILYPAICMASAGLSVPNKTYEFFNQPEAHPPDVIINEIMFDPDPAQGLPPFEYIELYNLDIQPVFLNHWEINEAVIPEYVFNPGTYLILSRSGHEKEFRSLGAVVGVSPWDVLNNDGQEIVLRDSSGTLIDHIDYRPGQIGDPVKKAGGWSIELINPFERCRGILNWTVSVDPSGGTPGKLNSVYSDVPDQTIPALLDQRWSSTDTLYLRFSKPVEFTGEEPGRYFRFNPALEIRLIQKDETETFSLLLLTAPSIEIGKPYELTLTDLTDCLGNEMEDTVFLTGIGMEPSFLDLLFTELLIDEIPSMGLPESEYLEIFNASGKIMDLEQSTIITRTDTFIMPGKNIYPEQYSVFCPASKIPWFHGIPNVTGISPFPKLLNEGQILALINKHHQLIFSLEYEKDWYRDLEKSEGGYSIEMIDLQNPCGNDENWRASDDLSGGTPGKPNSVSQFNPDRIGPSIAKVYLPDPNRIQVFLSEKIHPESIWDLEIIIPGRNDPKILSFDSLFYNRFTIFVEDPLLMSAQYEVRIGGLRDCVGNSMDSEGSHSTFFLPRSPSGNDLIINELMFNPRPGGVDWVEIYNKTTDYLDLTGVILCNFNSDFPDNQVHLDPPNQALAPAGFLVIAEDLHQLMADFPHSRPEAISRVASMPPLPDQFGNIAIVSPDQIILDHFYYSSDYHHDLITDDEGVSLERISYTDSTNHPENWQSASSTAGYGTPTYVNSAHISISDQDDLVRLQPPVISPDGDGVDDALKIHFFIGYPGYLGNIEIYDITGHLVKGIFQNKLLATEGTITWDGYSEMGQIPRTGIYLLRFEMYNLKGDHRVIKKKFVISRNR
jgi:hypothetical protein